MPLPTYSESMEHLKVCLKPYHHLSFMGFFLEGRVVRVLGERSNWTHISGSFVYLIFFFFSRASPGAQEEEAVFGSKSSSRSQCSTSLEAPGLHLRGACHVGVPSTVCIFCS